MFNRAQVLQLLKPHPYFKGFNDFTYEFRIIHYMEAITNLHTCQDGRVTFIELADHLLKNKHNFDKLAEFKFLRLADSLDDRPMFVLVFVHCDLKRRWPDEYPNNSDISDDALIVEDGNTRLTALAIRHVLKKLPVIEQVGIFVGHHP